MQFSSWKKRELNLAATHTHQRHKKDLQYGKLDSPLQCLKITQKVSIHKIHRCSFDAKIQTFEEMLFCCEITENSYDTFLIIFKHCVLFLPHEYVLTIAKNPPEFWNMYIGTYVVLVCVGKEVAGLWRNRKENINQSGFCATSNLLMSHFKRRSPVKCQRLQQVSSSFMTLNNMKIS